jgi:hypothetical protein
MELEVAGLGTRSIFGESRDGLVHFQVSQKPVAISLNFLQNRSFKYKQEFKLNYESMFKKFRIQVEFKISVFNK